MLTFARGDWVNLRKEWPGTYAFVDKFVLFTSDDSLDAVMRLSDFVHLTEYHDAEKQSSVYQVVPTPQPKSQPDLGARPGCQPAKRPPIEVPKPKFGQVSWTQDVKVTKHVDPTCNEDKPQPLSYAEVVGSANKSEDKSGWADAASAGPGPDSTDLEKIVQEGNKNQQKGIKPFAKAVKVQWEDLGFEVNEAADSRSRRHFSSNGGPKIVVDKDIDDKSVWSISNEEFRLMDKESQQFVNAKRGFLRKLGKMRAELKSKLDGLTDSKQDSRKKAEINSQHQRAVSNLKKDLDDLVQAGPKRTNQLRRAQRAVKRKTTNEKSADHYVTGDDGKRIPEKTSKREARYDAARTFKTKAEAKAYRKTLSGRSFMKLVGEEWRVTLQSQAKQDHGVSKGYVETICLLHVVGDSSTSHWHTRCVEMGVCTSQEFRDIFTLLWYTQRLVDNGVQYVCLEAAEEVLKRFGYPLAQVEELIRNEIYGTPAISRILVELHNMLARMPLHEAILYHRAWNLTQPEFQLSVNNLTQKKKREKRNTAVSVDGDDDEDPLGAEADKVGNMTAVRHVGQASSKIDPEYIAEFIRAVEAARAGPRRERADVRCAETAANAHAEVLKIQAENQGAIDLAKIEKQVASLEKAKLELEEKLKQVMGFRPPALDDQGKKMLQRLLCLQSLPEQKLVEAFEVVAMFTGQGLTAIEMMKNLQDLYTDLLNNNIYYLKDDEALPPGREVGCCWPIDCIKVKWEFSTPRLELVDIREPSARAGMPPCGPSVMVSAIRQEDNGFFTEHHHVTINLSLLQVLVRCSDTGNITSRQTQAQMRAATTGVNHSGVGLVSQRTMQLAAEYGSLRSLKNVKRLHYSCMGILLIVCVLLFLSAILVYAADWWLLGRSSRNPSEQSGTSHPNSTEPTHSGPSPTNVTLTDNSSPQQSGMGPMSRLVILIGSMTFVGSVTAWLMQWCRNLKTPRLTLTSMGGNEMPTVPVSISSGSYVSKDVSHSSTTKNSEREAS